MKTLIILSALALTGCGKWNRFITHWTGDLTYKCAKTGVEYTQSDSGLAVLYDQSGVVVKCKD